MLIVKNQHTYIKMYRNLLALIALCLLALSCGGKADKETKTETKRTTRKADLRVAVMPTLDALPLFIAKERGLFEKENLNVALVPFTAHMDVDTALVGGSVDMAFTDIVRTEKLMADKRVGLHYLTATELHWYLITNRTARINRLEQFGDKMVAMTRLSATEWLTNKTFDEVKTKAQVYGVQINDIDVRLKMLLNNEMDAEWLPEPQATAALAAGHKKLLDSDKYKTKFGVIAVRDSKKRDQQKEDKLKKIYSMACDSINRNGVKAYASVIAKYCHVSEDVAEKVPQRTYTHAEQPREETLKLAKQYKRR